MLELDHVNLPLTADTQEITRICKDLEAFIRRQSRSNNGQLARLASSPSNCELVVLAKSLIAERSFRARCFTEQDFGEPVWDILLDLYVSGYSSRRVSVTSACIAANVPATTALRYVSVLTSQGVLIRVLDEADARRVFVILSESARQAMREYLRRVYETRHAFPAVGEAPSQHERQHQISR
jgi:DNA-binding MarR family transcriptional regulator